MLSAKVSDIVEQISVSKAAIESSSTCLSELNASKDLLASEIKSYEETLSSNKNQLRLFNSELGQLRRKIELFKQAIQSSNDFIFTEVSLIFWDLTL